MYHNDVKCLVIMITLLSVFMMVYIYSNQIQIRKLTEKIDNIERMIHAK